MRYLLLLTLFFLVACGPSQEEELQLLKDEVLTIHDEIMPKMSELRRTRKDLLFLADSLMESNPDRAAMLTTVADEIGKANESMMEWMRAYKPDFKGTDEEIRQYLESQKVTIQKVKVDMLESLNKGKVVLDD